MTYVFWLNRVRKSMIEQYIKDIKKCKLEHLDLCRRRVAGKIPPSKGQ